MKVDYFEIWKKYNLPQDVREHCLKVSEVAVKIAEAIKNRCGHMDDSNGKSKRDIDTGVDVNIELVRIGALLHDIGRAETHDPFEHFIKSGEILRGEGCDEKIVRIAERHFSSGITGEEIYKLVFSMDRGLKLGVNSNLNSNIDLDRNVDKITGSNKNANLNVNVLCRDYIPVTIEEKIVSFADNIIFGSRIGDFEEFLNRLDSISEKYPEKAWFVNNSKRRAVEMKNELELLSGLEF